MAGTVSSVDDRFETFGSIAVLAILPKAFCRVTGHPIAIWL
ncbi:hypothetical protein ALP36_102163 [Pseudomonas syringae pv. coriandricola]|uniref:Uncharacterized protein n=3 Tax=Pseudomonas syringae group TaxID=136849 RepID=A0A0P9ZZ07_PSESX|nr:hypothetical protein ALO86_101676 [Pseudomonas syringae pv. berberidis]KPY28868.1 hypothetical protein ALO54_101880 [Pseudomonas syringae pv. philadelphi]KPY56083.1 hypothetical protein ALO94_100701 [Pseudomonas syringae pv. spinaceae]RMO91357.1 hypothetical protein ALQ32_101758 [Pseudomonas syringae pv. tagetis]RMR33492.1 hypothetical protein ALP87_102085 [Pseudomonas syringae pv. coriandricola]RMU96407.1 hypothetical protein ALP19_101844 [Pseudomonas syringae pv. tomato]